MLLKVPAYIALNAILTVASGFMFFAFYGCDPEDLAVASYSDQRKVSSIIVEESTHTPRITWLGGYVTALGVNRGGKAALDSTLVWLIFSQNDNLMFPVTFGSLPSGATNMTQSFGGQPISVLVEDEEYAFWVMKENAWSQLSAQSNKKLAVDSSATSTVRIVGDSVYLSPFSFTEMVDTADVFINITNINQGLGPLADFLIIETDTSNNPIVQFTIKQSDASDSLVAAIGLVEGSGVYDVNKVIWEVLSEEIVSGVPQYRTKNVIASPIELGQQIPETHEFVMYPQGGLKRGLMYYVWIAAKEWNGITRDTRLSRYYGWITFRTK